MPLLALSIHGLNRAHLLLCDGCASLSTTCPFAVVLQEMVMLPLVYPEIFARFSIKPPRGVLFCGPPGKRKAVAMARLFYDG